MRKVLVTSFVFVFAVAACGTDDDNGVDAGSGSPDPIETTTTTRSPDTPVTSPPVDPNAPVEPGDAEPIEPIGTAANLNPVSFDPADAEAGPGNSVLVRFYGGVAPCFVLDRYEVEETPETVAVTLYGGTDPDAGADAVCIEIAMLYEVDVPLAAPLGDRDLVDGSTN